MTALVVLYMVNQLLAMSSTLPVVEFRDLIKSVVIAMQQDLTLLV